MATKVESTESLRRASEWGASKATNLVEEFRKFALKGNVVDLAVGVIIGGAFAKIVDSMVKHILMPVLSLLFPSEQGYLGWKFAVGNKEIPYGLFLGEVVNFVIVAFALFLFAVKFLGWISRRQKEAEAIPPAPSKEEVLLAEIRDLLKTRAEQK
jgi:large conductance mechanosensitive channel